MLAAMKRLDSLDGVRGLLAFYVLLSHMAPFAELPNWIQEPVSHGGAAVDIFFVLSGLVITQSLLRAGGLAMPFLVARFARIFPVFLAVFVVAIVVAPGLAASSRCRGSVRTMLPEPFVSKAGRPLGSRK
jgi:peptidoglycan/LPS O-acetylase OafA/YrhL